MILDTSEGGSMYNNLIFQDSPHASEEEDVFEYDEYDLPLNQR